MHDGGIGVQKVLLNLSHHQFHMRLQAESKQNTFFGRCDPLDIDPISCWEFYPTTLAKAVEIIHIKPLTNILT